MSHLKGKKPETLHDFTERAIRAAEAGELIPPMVYIPVNLRRTTRRVTVDGSRVTVSPATDAENDLRVAQADPVGFLIAVMQGQPIPAFTLKWEREKGYSVETDYRVPDLLLRAECAHWLADRKRKLVKGDPEYDAMIARMAKD